MKSTLSIVLLFLITSCCRAQDGNEFRNESASQIFYSGQYKKRRHPGYPQQIEEIAKDWFRYGDRIINIAIEDTSFRRFFTSGIFNPDIIFGKLPDPVSQTGDTSAQTGLVNSFFRSDSLSICCFEELSALNPDPQTRRFSFWLFKPGLMNPTEYYIEFYNKHAIKKTSSAKFIAGSYMTFFAVGTVIL